MNKRAKVRDPVTGPLSREELRALVDAPFGHATNEIRKYDPLYGRAEGEKFDWVVTCQGTMIGKAHIEASNQEEADKLANELTEAEIDWGGYGDGNFYIISVEPD